VDLDITGGSGGVGAALEDLTAGARQLADVAAQASSAAGALLRAATSPDLLGAALARPVETARLGAWLAAAAGPAGLGGEAGALWSLAALVRSAAAAYAASEAAACLLIEGAQDSAVFLLARSAGTLAVGAHALDRAGMEVAGMEVMAAADRAVFRAPWIADLAGGLEGVVAGPVTPMEYEDALALVSRAGSVRGWLSEAGRRVDVAAVAPSGAAVAPTSLAGLVAAQADLGAPGAGPGRVRVVEVAQADGSSAWVVLIPGTQDWSPRTGANPSDLTSDVLLMAGEATLLAAGVERALGAAQATAGRADRGDPVLLAGHSQGGIAAAALAADSGFRSRQRVTHVVTSGAPTARFAVPPSVQVLALEHVQDPVTRLEGRTNPDRVSRLTVTRDLREDAGVGSEAGGRASAAHRLAGYEATARLADHAGSRSLADWRAGSAAFLAGDAHGPAVVRDFALARTGLVARSAG
jgi:hypothetical protein